MNFAVGSNELVCTVKLENQAFIEQLLIGLDNRKGYFLGGLNEYIANQAQLNGINCWLKRTSCWFSKPSASYHAVYACADERCSVKYRVYITNLKSNPPLDVLFYADKDDEHQAPVDRTFKNVSPLGRGRRNRPSIEQNYIQNQIEQEISSGESMSEIEFEPIKQPSTPVDEARLFLSRENNSNPINWRCEDVCKFVNDLAGEKIANEFRWHDIDGMALDYLDVATITNLLTFKLGYAARIKRNFDQLKTLF